jgi:hypothetical protein
MSHPRLALGPLVMQADHPHQTLDLDPVVQHPHNATSANEFLLLHDQINTHHCTLRTNLLKKLEGYIAVVILKSWRGW